MSPDQVISHALLGNKSAIAFVEMITDLAHFWDDLIDRDVQLSDEVINQQMFNALITLPRNEFYRMYQAELWPVLLAAIVNWRAATAAERNNTDGNELQWAFIIRSSYVDLIAVSAVLVGGVEHAAACVPLIRNLVHGEGFVTYREKLSIEAKERGKLYGMESLRHAKNS